ncbi:hypothetical protein PR048_019843 [Dryococelus australis]|uniref:Uncharacterized protein n=1 Tax=Dryococelus australis TaxID=614101 RepID=A0ABQ9H4Q6_9NEOP|nr:hypothetical protein PR048_019843 [Dryococelus australis]
MKQSRNTRAGKTGDPEKTYGPAVVRNDSHVRKSGSSLARNRTRFAWVEREKPNNYITVVTLEINHVYDASYSPWVRAHCRIYIASVGAIKGGKKGRPNTANLEANKAGVTVYCADDELCTPPSNPSALSPSFSLQPEIFTTSPLNYNIPDDSARTVGCVIFPGAAVAERLACSPRTKRFGFNPRPCPSSFSHVGIVPDDALGRRVFTRISRFPRPFISTLLHASITLIGSQDLDVKNGEGNERTSSALFSTFLRRLSNEGEPRPFTLAHFRMFVVPFATPPPPPSRDTQALVLSVSTLVKAAKWQLRASRMIKLGCGLAAITSVRFHELRFDPGRRTSFTSPLVPRTFTSFLAFTFLPLNTERHFVHYGKFGLTAVGTASAARGEGRAHPEPHALCRLLRPVDKSAAVVRRRRRLGPLRAPRRSDQFREPAANTELRGNTLLGNWVVDINQLSESDWKSSPMKRGRSECSQLEAEMQAAKSDSSRRTIW